MEYGKFKEHDIFEINGQIYGSIGKSDLYIDDERIGSFRHDSDRKKYILVLDDSFGINGLEKIFDGKEHEIKIGGGNIDFLISKEDLTKGFLKDVRAIYTEAKKFAECEWPYPLGRKMPDKLDKILDGKFVW